MTPPPFYRPERVGTLHHPDMIAIAAEAAENRIAGALGPRHALLLIDFQVDFCHEKGSLAVPGAIDDLRRTIEFLYGHIGEIATLYASLDTHHVFQIFHPNWWKDEAGEPPPPFTEITVADIRSGKWLPARQKEWSIRYVGELERGGRQSLVVWPYHALLGSIGHALDPTLMEAALYHSLVRHSPIRWISKGDITRTEHYSIFEPEVKMSEMTGGTISSSLLSELASFDRVYVAGEAKSHCVLASLRSIVDMFPDQPKILNRFHLLTDCTSSVVHPEIDFDAKVDATLAEYAERGLNLVSSTD